MRCPWAIQTIMLYCAGTDQSCKLDEVNHFHLFRVSNNVISFNVKQGQHYELFVPADKDSQGLWHNEGIVPYEQAPDFRDRIDPLALIGFHTLGVFTAASNVTTASLRRLAGGNRIGICRIDPLQAYRALPGWHCLFLGHPPLYGTNPYMIRQTYHCRGSLASSQCFFFNGPMILLKQGLLKICYIHYCKHLSLQMQYYGLPFLSSYLEKVP